jgi:hypothetical protein
MRYAGPQADVTQATQTVRLAGITKLKPVKVLRPSISLSHTRTKLS